MEVQPTPDKGQEIKAVGRVMGVLTSQADADAMVGDLERTGTTKASIQVLSGEEGIQLLDRVDTFYCADGEHRAIDDYVRRLREGRFVLSVRVADDAAAQRVASLGAAHNGGDFTYFGPVVVTRFN